MAPTAFVFCLILTTALGYTAPGKESKFRHVLDRSKLQSPDSSTAVKKPFEVADWYFYRDSSKDMVFKMKGEKKRTELRQMTTGGDNSAWKVSGSEKLTAELSIPNQPSGIDEVTFLQVHCGVKPALRISWMRNFRGNEDAIVAILRLNANENGDTEKYYLGKRSSEMKDYVVLVKDSKIYVSIDGKKVGPSPMKASFWKSYSCYFKAGVYIIHESKSSAVARSTFRNLRWP
ncbi:unnamed protein product [Agarophyton chilense]